MASGSGSAPEGLLPRRESLWLGEGKVSPEPCKVQDSHAPYVVHGVGVRIVISPHLNPPPQGGRR